jgi:hypothetical protein
VRAVSHAIGTALDSPTDNPRKAADAPTVFPDVFMPYLEFTLAGGMGVLFI